VIDNEALFNISHNVLKHKLPRYVDLNWMISLVMSGITSSLRFPGLLNGDMRKMGVNLVPFPRLHFFLLAQAPLFPAEAAKHYNLNIQEVTSQMWSSRNFLAHVKPQEGKYLTATTIYRQKEASTQEIDQEVSDVRSKMDDDFVRWIPHSIKTSIVNVPPLHVPVSGTFVANTTSIKAVFERISGQFAKMYKRKAFLHWYKGEGMDITEFEEADKNVRDLVLEYQDKQDAVVPEENEEEDNEDDVAEEEEEENDYGF
jgi:tubulin beta